MILVQILLDSLNSADIALFESRKALIASYLSQQQTRSVLHNHLFGSEKEDIGPQNNCFWNVDVEYSNKCRG
jgi:hypothetical protein